MSAWRIPFNRASLVGNELALVQEAVANGHISGDGPFTRRCESLLERELAVPRVLLTTSGTHALELAALLLAIEPGDEVVVPSFAFPSCAGAFALRGAHVVFCDIRPDTLNLDESLLEPLLSPRTRAVVVLHYAGIGCEMDRVIELAAGRTIPVVEDNAHGLFGNYRGRALGTIGAVAAQSFHETKNITCGEGGALVLNDAGFVDRAEVIREKGTNRKQYFLGQVDKYTWVDLGSSYIPSELLAAFLAAQLEARAAIQRARQRLWERYAEALADWAGRIGARLPIVPEHCEQAFHQFHVLLPSNPHRTRVIDHLRERGILAAFHYLPLHLSAMGRRLGGEAGQCPVTEDASDRLLRLPFFTSLTEAEQAEVVEAIEQFGG